MSMYGMIHGQNPLSDVILALAGLTRDEVGRFRDCYLSVVDGQPVVNVYTRNGGGNRDCWEDNSAEDCGCPGCVISRILPKHQNYIDDSDDDFDSTYATIRFRVSESMLEPARQLIALGEANRQTPEEKWKSLRETLDRGDKNDPEFQRFLEAGKPLVEALEKALSGDNPENPAVITI